MRGRAIRREDPEYLTRDAMEQRRLDGVLQLRRGVSQATVARNLGVSGTTTSRWNRDLRRHADMHSRKAPGRPARLTKAQEQAVIDLYLEMREAAGRRGSITTADFALAVEHIVGVRYHPDHMGRVMHRLGLPITARRGRKTRAAG